MSESSSLWSAGNVRPKRQQAEQNFTKSSFNCIHNTGVSNSFHRLFISSYFSSCFRLKVVCLFFFLTPFFRDKVSESCFTGQLSFGMRTSDSDSTTPDPAQGYATGRIVEIPRARRVCLSNHAVGTPVFVHQSDSKATLA